MCLAGWPRITVLRSTARTAQPVHYDGGICCWPGRVRLRAEIHSSIVDAPGLVFSRFLDRNAQAAPSVTLSTYGQNYSSKYFSTTTVLRARSIEKQERHASNAGSSC
jgi:hypothetical protein